MGFAKNLQIEQGEYGFSMQDFRAVCPACIGEEDLAAFVAARRTLDHCDFCDRDGTNIAADAEDVLRHVGTSIKLEYEEAVGVLPLDGESPTGYFGDVFFFAEALSDAGVEIENGAFSDYVMEAFRDAYLCERDPFGLRKHEVMTDIWSAFRHVVEASPDFDPAVQLRSLTDVDERWTAAAEDVLKSIADLVQEVGLLRRLEAGTTLFRGRRPHPPGVRYTQAAQLGTPPVENAGDGRMNRKGAPLFYGAEEIDTAYAELVELPVDIGKVITVGTFEMTEGAWMVDLSALPDFPGIFHESRQHQRQAILFLRGFREDISEPVSSSADPNPGYRPTQVIAEHLLANCLAPDGTAPRGIVYPSARRRDGENVVLDVVSRDCIEAAEHATSGMLQLRMTCAPRRRQIF